MSFAATLTAAEAPASIACAHCGNPVPAFRQAVAAEARPFCCTGCETVFAILQRGLAPARGEADFAYLDDPEFRRLYAANGETMDFFLEGVHCASCVWLVEKVPGLVAGVAEASLDLGRSVASVRLAEGGSFAAAAEQLAQFGYRPCPVKEAEADRLLQKENRRLMTRLGVAAACTMNIMLFAVALYSGAAEQWGAYFAWASFAFFLPILLYSSVPFYASSIASARAGRMSIDIPIVIGVWVGTGLGIANLFKPGRVDHVYFDSLAMLVFLLLSSRYLTRRAQQRSLATARLVFTMMPATCRRWSEPAGKFIDAPVESLTHGERVLLRPGDIFPADGVIVSGTTELNTSVLTGESRPEQAGVGTEVFAGTLNVSGLIEMTVEASGAQTRVGQIMKLMQDAAGRRTPLATLADRISGWFTAAIVAIGALTFFYWARFDVQSALDNTMALFIVTCPCALAMSAPVASLVSMGRAARRGMLVKSPDVFERLHAVDEVFLDKTGTLTEGKFTVESIAVQSSTVARIEIEEAVYALEKNSNHPIALAIVNSLRGTVAGDGPVAVDYVERIGHGVAGTVRGHRYEVFGLGASSSPGPSASAAARRQRGDDGGATELVVLRDSEKVAAIRLGDRLRPDSRSAVDELRDLGVAPYVLSGDSPAAVASASEDLGIAADHAWSRATPERKLALVQEHANAAMIGDGVNDSAALAAAKVGIAVHGGMEASMRAADVYLLQPGVSGVARLMRAARETVGVIHRNFWFSLAYNLIGATASVTGHMSPLAAAVLMPISSLTILSSSVWGAKSLR